MRCSSLILPSAIIMICISGCTSTSPDTVVVTYRGFSVQYAEGSLTEMEPVLRKQIDKLMSVGLPDEFIALFRTVPIHARIQTEHTSGHFRNNRVELDGTLLHEIEKPVLIHEFMHALHYLRLPAGVHNPQILSYYEQAGDIPAYNSSSHMMSNVREYFATTATSYLYGITAQEPFNREKIRKNQPEYYEYLTNLFGPRAGAYTGVLK